MTAAIFFICKLNTANAQVNLQDSFALVDLYNSTDGPHWHNNINWLTQAPLSTWAGVGVDNGRVNQLFLSDYGLNGTLPASLGNLTNLIYLILDNNYLTGTIPSTIGNIYYLQFFYCNNNQLSGKIPTSIGSLSKMQEMRLDNNQLTGIIPSSLGNLTELYLLNLSDNELKGWIPSSLSNLSNLKYLLLNNNQLNGTIPGSFGNLKSLIRLDLSYNKLRGNIPAGIGKLYRLKYLYFENNYLRGKIPTTFSNLNRLINLQAGNNNFSGAAPSFLTTNPALKHLGLAVNNYTFDGMEELAGHNFATFVYAPQKNISLHFNNKMFSVSAGGTLSNNTYKWYKGANLVATIQDDSTFTPSENGNYSVAVTNAVATELTLYSDTINYVANSDFIASNIKSEKKTFTSVFPNPVKTNTTLSFPASGNYTINIVDINGKTIQTITGVSNKKQNVVNVNLSHYSSGIYNAVITDEKNEKRVLKILKE